MVKNEINGDLDAIDWRILQVLQNDGRIRNARLAREVGLSPSSCLERVRRLERRKYILGYRAMLNPQKLGAGLLVYVEIRLTRTSAGLYASFRQKVLDMPEVQECHLISGDFDYLIKARLPDMQAYRTFLGETLLMLPGVAASRTFVVMEEVKETCALALHGAAAETGGETG